MTRTSDLGGLQVDWPSTPAGPPPPRRSRLSFLRELPALVAIAFGLALLIKSLLVQAFFIPSESMVPTFEIGDRVLVNKLAYRFREPRRGEIIVFIAQKDQRPRSLMQRVTGLFTEGLGLQVPAEKDFIKRVIGLPGETIEVTEAGVFVTPREGKRLKLTEPYIADAKLQGPPQHPFVVPTGTVFVMGDNRNRSSDSRSQLGPVKISDIIGKAFVKIWPPRRAGSLATPSYSARPPPAADGAAVPPLGPVAAFALVGVRRRAR